MRLIAIRNFRNPRRAITVNDSLHEDHVHKGAIFAIGPDELDKDEKAAFKKLNNEQKRLLMELSSANCIGNAAIPQVVDAVVRELAEEKKRAESLKEQYAQQEVSIGRQLGGFIETAGKARK